MTALRPYPAYKDSGIDWLEEVPEHWDVRWLGTFGRFFKGSGGTKADETDEGVPCVRYGDLYTRHQFHITESKACVAPHRAGAYTPVRYGDVLFAGSGETLDEIGKSAVNLIRRSAVCGGDVIVFRPTIDVDAEFIGWSTDCRQAAFHKARMGRGMTVMHIYSSDLKRLAVPLPPLPEQTAIARFLDHADRRIRRYISAKERLIELLEEQKQAIIHQAVTGQIDVRTGQPYPAYKDSGVEWLGEVPEHWEVVALKWVLDRLVDCEHKTAPAVDESEYRVVRTTAVRGGSLRWEGTYCTSKEAFLHDWTQRATPRPGDVVFTREAPVGEACVVPAGAQVCLGQRTVLMRPSSGEYDPDFLVHMIYAGPPRDHVRLAAQGTTVGHFNMEDIGALTVLKPPFSEQIRLVSEIGIQKRRLDRAVARTERQVSLLREFRRCLIANAVTGKLDVREAVAWLPEVDTLSANDLRDGAEASNNGYPQEPEPCPQLPYP